MNKTFTYTFKKIVRNNPTHSNALECVECVGNKETDYHFEEVTLKKKVTDRMEARNFHKAAYAAEWFTQKLRTEHGMPRAIVLAIDLKEI